MMLTCLYIRNVYHRPEPSHFQKDRSSFIEMPSYYYYLHEPCVYFKAYKYYLSAFVNVLLYYIQDRHHRFAGCPIFLYTNVHYRFEDIEFPKTKPF